MVRSERLSESLFFSDCVGGRKKNSTSTSKNPTSRAARSRRRQRRQRRANAGLLLLHTPRAKIWQCCFLLFYLQFSLSLHGAVRQHAAVPGVTALERDQLRGRVPVDVPPFPSHSFAFCFSFRLPDQRQQQNGPDRGHGADQDQQREPREIGRCDS